MQAEEVTSDELPISPNKMIKTNSLIKRLKKQHSVTLNNAPIHWDLEKGNIQFFGVDAAIFWTNPSLARLFMPIVEEIGPDLFRVIVANSSTDGTEKDYQAMISTLGSNFKQGFAAWGEAVATAGWGKFKLLEYDWNFQHAVIQVDNPWELAAQKNLSEEQRWGCPFLLGKMIGIFNNALECNCWATDNYEYLSAGGSRVTLTIFPSNKTLDSELETLRAENLTRHEQELALEIKEKTAELQKSNSLLENIANLDFLTNLNNRRSLEKKLSDIKNDDTWDDYILMFVDLDQFKIINDTCGHLAGDRLLTIIGERLIRCVGHEHFICRYGGDEFAILLNQQETQLAVDLAHKIRETISKTHFEWKSNTYYINCSIGLAPLNIIDTEVDNAIIAADNACYQAKKNGRNQIYISEQMSQFFESRLSEMHWVNKIKDAIQNNRFKPYFQLLKPLASDNNKISLEALIRMVDTDGNLIMPDNFLPAAEAYDVIFDLDCWVIEYVFKKLQVFEDPNDTIESIAINLSGNTLSNPKLEGFIDACFRKYQVNPEKICFEITETHMMMNIDTAKMLLAKLRKHGCTVSLDDFGAGMSSFGYLRELPIDKIKIDGSFVKNMDKSMVDYTFVESIINVASAMEIKTVAEFVENERIVELLTDVSVDYLQGYHIGKPKPWEHFFQHRSS